jgi:pyruvate dehydrogenase E2 component (dihydrolipoamide acetyltransferase)
MKTSFRLPDLGEGIHEGEVLAVLVSAGDKVQEEDPILEIETDKAAVEIPSPYSGQIVEIHVQPGDMVKVGQVLITFEADQLAGAGSADADEAAGTQMKAEVSRQTPQSPVPASPATRKLARELGVELASVSPSGPSGLVTADDVRAHAAEANSAKKAPQPLPHPEGQTEVYAPPTGDLPELPDFSVWGPTERMPMRSIRRATARQMTIAWSQIPHVTTQDVVDLTKLEAFRQKHKHALQQQGGKLTLTVFALKAAATALKRFPRFNASLDTRSEEMILKQYYHLGVAVDTTEGLLVPVIRDVDRKSISELAIELHHLGQKAHERKLSLEELQGGTFTITNIGRMGGSHFFPIINFPQVAIMGMGAARMQPVVRESKTGKTDIVARLLMPLVLTIDHRILDGGDATRFMRVIIDALEDPEELLMTMS